MGRARGGCARGWWSIASLGLVVACGEHAPPDQPPDGAAIDATAVDATAVDARAVDAMAVDARVHGPPRIVRWGGGIVSPSWITVDDAGNLYVTGHTLGVFPDRDTFVARFDPAGALVWTRTWGTADLDYASWVFVHGSELIVVGFPTIVPSGRGPVWIRRMSTDGAMLDHRLAQTPAGVELYAALLDGDTVVVAGSRGSFSDPWIARLALDGAVVASWQGNPVPAGCTSWYFGAVSQQNRGGVSARDRALLASGLSSGQGPCDDGFVATLSPALTLVGVELGTGGSGVMAAGDETYAARQVHGTFHSAVARVGAWEVEQPGIARIGHGDAPFMFGWADGEQAHGSTVFDVAEDGAVTARGAPVPGSFFYDAIAVDGTIHVVGIVDGMAALVTYP